jgi:hypothetical protein
MEDRQKETSNQLTSQAIHTPLVFLAVPDPTDSYSTCNSCYFIFWFLFVNLFGGLRGHEGRLQEKSCMHVLDMGQEGATKASRIKLRKTPQVSLLSTICQSHCNVSQLRAAPLYLHCFCVGKSFCKVSYATLQCP